MIIRELIVPGVWLEESGIAKSDEFELILNHTLSKYEDLLLCFDMYMSEKKRKSQDRFFERESNSLENRQIHFNAELEFKKKIEDLVISKLPELPPTASFDEKRLRQNEVSFQVELIIKRMKWSNNQGLDSLLNKRILIHARSFLTEMDGIKKSLSTLEKHYGIEERIAPIVSKFDEAFPDLSGLRNSVQHQEDRLRRKKAHEKEINFKPIDNGRIKSSGDNLFMNMLINDKYGGTTADGNYGEIDITISTIETTQAILQELLYKLNWRGPKRIIP